MAYQTRGRDPLLDSSMTEMLEKRGKELLGLALIFLGVIAAMMIGSYTPDDPNFMVSTDAPVQNWLGRMGATLAGPLFMIVGWGAWGIAVVLLVWGIRFALHWGQERAMGRLIFAPIAIALGSIYATTLPPGPEWLATHSFGLGGLFGETVMGMLVNILPIGSIFAVKLMSFVMAIGIVTLGAFVLGFTKLELRGIGRFLLVGTIVAYAKLMTLLGRGASGAVSAAQTMQMRQSERREKRRVEAAENAAFTASQPVMQPADAGPSFAQGVIEETAPEEKAGLLARMPTLIKRSEPAVAMPQQELVEPQSVAVVQEDGPDTGERIKSKISDVIKSRVRSTNAVHVPTTAPLTRGRGRGPDALVLDTNAPQRTPLTAEPPLTATPRQEPPLTAPAIQTATPAPQAIPVMPEAPASFQEFVTPEMGAMPVPQPTIDPVADRAAPPAPLPVSAPVTEPRRVVQQPIRKPVQPSKQAKAEAQPALSFEDSHPGFELPPLALLESADSVQRLHLSDEALEENARMLETVLDDYGVKGEIVAVRPGPVVTMYELEPAPGLKASRVIGLADDIARSMAALSARVSTVPGRSVIGIELPNENREKVVLREILSSRDFGDGNQNLPLALGKDIGGEPVVANLAKMPHLLIAGTTGSGKSVAINTMILSLLYKLTPEECRMIMIDPKMLELSVYGRRDGRTLSQNVQNGRAQHRRL